MVPEYHLGDDEFGTVQMAKSPIALTEIEIAVIRNLLERQGVTNQAILGQINAKRRAEGRPETNGAAYLRCATIMSGMKVLQPPQMRMYRFSFQQSQ